jgi:hypothetical protein
VRTMTESVEPRVMVAQLEKNRVRRMAKVRD